MGTPTQEELHEAIRTASLMREQDNDPHYIAKSLLNLNYRIKFLQEVMHAAESYLRGEGGTEHAKLVKSIALARHEEAHTAGHDDDGVII